MDVVCFPFHDYKVALNEGFRTRDAHIYSSLEKLNYIDKVIIFNRPTLLLEKLLGKKTFETGGKVVHKSPLITIQRFGDNMFVVDCKDFSFLPPVLKGKAFIPSLYFKNRNNFKQALSIIGVNSFISYESSPLTRELVESLRPKAKVFDGVDNFCKHSTYRDMKSWLEVEYKKIINSYDAVYFNSKDSVNYFSASNNKNVTFLSNGVDFERFQGKYFQPSEMKVLQKRIGVYAGKMQSMFDIELVKQLALEHKDVDWVFLGKVLEGEIDTQFDSFPNVYFFGDIHYESLPNYIKSADFCIIPYLVEKQHGGDPIKFYEYYASGAPIVSTPIGEIATYHDGISTFIVEKHEFSAAVNKIKNLTKVSNRVLPIDFTWRAKADLIFKPFNTVGDLSNH